MSKHVRAISKRYSTIRIPWSKTRLLYQNLNAKNKKKFPTNRIRTSDLEITASLYSLPLCQLSYSRMKSPPGTQNMNSTRFYEKGFIEKLFTHRGVQGLVRG